MGGVVTGGLLGVELCCDVGELTGEGEGEGPLKAPLPASTTAAATAAINTTVAMTPRIKGGGSWGAGSLHANSWEIGRFRSLRVTLRVGRRFRGRSFAGRLD